MVKNSGALSFSECCSNGTMCPKKRVGGEKQLRSDEQNFHEMCPAFFLLKELSFKEKLFYISKFISNYFKYKLKNI